MNIFEKLYHELKEKYGKPKEQWRLWCKRPKTNKEREEVMIGAILTQRTSWRNVELALGNIKRARVLSIEKIYQLAKRNPEFLKNLIKPAGFYKIKAQYLFNLTRFFVVNYGSLEIMKKVDPKELREKLLKVKGIGPETADSILLYALDKPIFVIDEYTKRLIKEKKLAEKINYCLSQKLFEENLRKDFRLYQDFHALIVINGKNKKNENFCKGQTKGKRGKN